MTLGFVRLSKGLYKPVRTNDVNEYAAVTYTENFGNHCIVGEIVDLPSSPDTEIPSAEIVVGGLPCHGFSLLNKERKEDPRKQLWRPFFKIAGRSGLHVVLLNKLQGLSLSSLPEDRRFQRKTRTPLPNIAAMFVLPLVGGLHTAGGFGQSSHLTSALCGS